MGAQSPLVIALHSSLLSPHNNSSLFLSSPVKRNYPETETHLPPSLITLMASSKLLLHAKRGPGSYIFVNPETAETDRVISRDNHFEFDEADVWNGYTNSSGGGISQSEVKRFLPRKAAARNKVATTKTSVTCASSLPLNIPDWSKVYRAGHGSRLNLDDHDGDNNDTDENDDDRVPIHEYLARRRGASFSVHEGIGRTLKGRDLRQVRNAIWKQVGFED